LECGGAATPLWERAERGGAERRQALADAEAAEQLEEEEALLNKHRPSKPEAETATPRSGGSKRSASATAPDKA